MRYPLVLLVFFLWSTQYVYSVGYYSSYDKTYLATWKVIGLKDTVIIAKAYSLNSKRYSIGDFNGTR
jgi:hypothetical protein